MRLFLLRHGESLHSRRGIIASAAGCPGLTERGHEQAERLAQRLQHDGILEDGVVLLSSPALRARQTAAPIEALAGCAVEIDARLTEIDTGVAEGLSWDTYRATHGGFDLVAEPERPFAPGGESWDGFLTRIEQALQSLAACYEGKTVIAATHAGFIVVSFLVLFAIPHNGSRARLEPAYASITEWKVSQGIWQLVGYNDAAHV